MFTLRHSKRFLRFGSRLASAHQHTSSQTHFGFETVDESEKEGRVREVFQKVADNYDVMNDAMSFGVHRLWKDHFVGKINPQPHFKCLDVAGGTGDIAFRLHKHMSNISSDPEKIVICDINPDMLRVGQDRAVAKLIRDQFEWVEGNAESLPFEDGSFDVYTIAFGIRNCTHIDQVLAEAHRVLKRGGVFMCLEFSDVSNPVLSNIYDRYSFDVIPVMGQLIAGDFESYKYLVESIRKFPDQASFAGMISDAGFDHVAYEDLTFGVTAIHSGVKL